MADRSHKFTALTAGTVRVAKAIQYSSSGNATKGAFSGISNAASSTIVIATPAVASGATIAGWMLQPMAPNSGDANMPAWVVKSFNPGVGFVAGTVCSYGLTSSYKLHWTLAARV